MCETPHFGHCTCNAHTKIHTHTSCQLSDHTWGKKNNFQVSMNVLALDHDPVLRKVLQNTRYIRSVASPEKSPGSTQSSKPNAFSFKTSRDWKLNSSKNYLQENIVFLRWQKEYEQTRQLDPAWQDCHSGWTCCTSDKLTLRSRYCSK